MEEGRYRPAVEELREAVRLGELIGSQTLLALALHNRAEAWLGLGELRRARIDADEALALWQRAGSPLAAFGMTLTARVHRVCGAARQAMAAYQTALAMAESEGNAQVLVEACAGLARLSYADSPEVAAQYAERALSIPSAAGPTVAELAAGWVALCSDDPRTALRYAEQVRSEAGRRRDAAGLAEAMELAALAAHRAKPEAAATRAVRRLRASLVEAAAIWRELGNEFALATNALLQARLSADPVAEEVAGERLNLIGVQEGAWHVAGPFAAIGPAPVRRHPPDRYLATGPATVGINPTHVSVDALRFYEAARAAIAADGASTTVARPHGSRNPGSAVPAGDDVREDGDVQLLGRLEAVAAMYTGEFCDDGDNAGDWVRRPRAVLADLHREVIHHLARRCLRLGRTEAAIGWYLRLTVEDSYVEPAHLGLISALSDAGRHGEARRRYQEYAARMREMDVEPATFPSSSHGASARLNNS